MTYLTRYLDIGIVVLVLFVVFVFLRRDKKPDSQSLSEPLAAIHVETKTLRNRSKDDLITPVLVGALVVGVWPVALFLMGQELYLKKAKVTLDENRAFTVTQADLLQHMSVEEIEQHERIVDPLGAVPDLPFGHLHTAWRKFLNGLEPQDEIWTFSARWTTNWGHKEIRAGYVALRAGAIATHFLTTWETLEEDLSKEI